MLLWGRVGRSAAMFSAVRAIASDATPRPYYLASIATSAGSNNAANSGYSLVWRAGCLHTLRHTCLDPVPAGFYIHLDDDLPTPHLSFGASPGPHDVPRMAEIASRSRRPNRALNKESLAEARRVSRLERT